MEALHRGGAYIIRYVAKTRHPTKQTHFRNLYLKIVTVRYQHVQVSQQCKSRNAMIQKTSWWSIAATIAHSTDKHGAYTTKMQLPNSNLHASYKRTHVHLQAMWHKCWKGAFFGRWPYNRIVLFPGCPECSAGLPKMAESLAGKVTRNDITQSVMCEHGRPNSLTYLQYNQPARFHHELPRSVRLVNMEVKKIKSSNSSHLH